MSPRFPNLLGGLVVAALVSWGAALFLRAPEAQGGSGGPAQAGPLRTGLVYQELFLEHDTGKTHPEQPARLTAILRRLKETGMLPTLTLLEPSPAPLQWVETIHRREYLREVQRGCEFGQRFLHSPDTPVSARSYEVALLAAGGVLTAIDAVLAGRVRNAFCAIRPPGHHALPDRAMGFCLFNNVAIGARYVQQAHGLQRVLIVDWDVHHGNGTQAVFEDDPTVLYFSVHQHPFYPGTGNEDEQGFGQGGGYTVNVPLPAGCGDQEYLAALREVLRPKALAFHPDFVLVSAGFDAHEDDPLGGMRVTAQGFAQMTAVVREIAEESCRGRLVSVLEGGYDLEGLAVSVAAHISALQQPPKKPNRE